MPRAPTLPDLLRPGLDIVFVGINPSLYSVAAGHYFARRTNRFWPAFSRSRLSERARATLGIKVLLPEHDRALLEFGFGFTDAVKRASARAEELSKEEFAKSVPLLVRKIERFRPRVACFHGVTSYRALARALDPAADGAALGLQRARIVATRLFVVPNPSPANAHFTLADQIAWYDRLAALNRSLD
ncbi:MAG TPA: mismatch-specific DNA-glycosylase [Stellaceae bacterium]|nr:mismatch-specific DNA-glycosylase [Stellaceae bacterium]